MVIMEHREGYRDVDMTAGSDPGCITSFYSSYLLSLSTNVSSQLPDYIYTSFVLSAVPTSWSGEVHASTLTLTERGLTSARDNDLASLGAFEPYLSTGPASSSSFHTTTNVNRHHCRYTFSITNPPCRIRSSSPSKAHSFDSSISPKTSASWCTTACHVRQSKPPSLPTQLVRMTTLTP